MILKTEAVVLKTFEFRETSRIAIFFSKDYGKLKGLLKGIRKDPRKFGSSLERFSVNDIVFYTYRNSEINLVSQCDLKEYFFELRQDLKKVVAAHYFLELISAMMPLEEKNEKIYPLLLRALSELGRQQDVSRLVHTFQIKLLKHSGFRPHIDSCLFCRRKIGFRAKFSLQLGGLLCADCQVKDSSAMAVSQGAIASLLHLEKSDWPQSLRLVLPPNIKKELKYILNNFLVFHLERQMKSSRYLI